MSNTAQKLNEKFTTGSELGAGFAAMFGTPHPVADSKHAQNTVEELPTSALHSFGYYDSSRAALHRYKPYADEKMQRFAENVKENGILQPLLVRQHKTNAYEILAGHNRKRGGELAGLETLPCMVLDVDDDQALAIMHITNIDQRDELTPTEKGWAYRSIMELRNRQGERTDLTFSRCGNKFDLDDNKIENDDEKVPENAAGDDMLAGKSQTVVYRYIRLTYLCPALAERVDAKEMTVAVGESLSWLTDDTQRHLNTIIRKKGLVLTTEMAKALKDAFKERHCIEDDLLNFLFPKRNGSKGKKTAPGISVRFTMEKVQQYFPGKNKREIEAELMALLEERYGS